MKILTCAYRQWALDTHRMLHRDQMLGHSMALVTSPENFEQMTEKETFDITILLGWSWILKPSYVKNNFTVVIHPSDLPNYAGGSPIQNQIIDGLKESKVTLFKAEPNLDAGPIIDKEPFSLVGTLNDVFDEIQFASFKLLKRFLYTYPHHAETPQGESTPSRRRTPEMSEIRVEDFDNYTAEDIHDKIRCLQDPYPLPFIRCKNNTKLFLKETLCN